MNIGIIGFGYVGSAIAWAHNHDEVIINDPQLSESIPLEKFVACDAVYICVPSPSKENGECDTSILESVLEQFTVHESVPIISKVTAPPEVYSRLQKKYTNLVHVPEFLTAKNNIKDYMRSKFLVIGGAPNHANVAADIITSTVDVSESDILITDIETASFFKYMMNSYLASKVTFMNEFYALAEKDGIDWKEVQRLAKHDSRIGITHMNVPGDNGSFGWEGACFPKDVDAIINYAESKGMGFDLLESVKTINRKHRSRKND
jgi:UDPglucose 6-dehydrogenase